MKQKNNNNTVNQNVRCASYILFCILPITCCLLVTSCRKAGTSGDASLMVSAEHHGVTIINHVGYPDTVYLKFNVDEMPGTKPTDYDIYFVGTPREEYVHCEGLKSGKYYVYVTGMDSAGPYRVMGGMPLKIKWNQRKDHIMLTVPVTE